MSSTLKNNAYHILGLDTTASQKDILKRSREIIKYLEINDLPEYNLDLGLFDNFRTKESTSEAIQKLQAPKKRIKEYFFWFQIADSVDEQALGLIKLKDFENALRVWENVAEKKGIKSFFYKKNLAILNCLLLYINNNKDYLKNSLSIWKELIESDKFWTAFSRTYNLYNEQTASQTLITDFKKHVASYLADIYTELSEIYQDTDYINQFQKVFSVKGKKIEEDILKPTYETINEAVVELKKIKINKGDDLSKSITEKIKKSTITIQSELNKLIDIGLYDDNQTKIIRDKAANVLRSLSIDLHNNLNEVEMALEIAKIAEKISGTDSYKSKVQSDVITLQENFKFKTKENEFKKIIDPIVQKIKNGESNKALEDINYLLYSDETDAELKKVLKELKQAIEERIVKYGKPIKNAPSMHTINGIGTRVYGDTLYFVVLFIPLIPIARYSLKNHGDGSYSFFGKLELHKWQKYWQYILIGVIIIWILGLILNG